MKTKILITAATEKELFSVDTSDMAASFEFDTIVTGVGSVSTVYALMAYLHKNGRPDYIINIGIAGSFTSELALGDTMIVESDCFADIGVESQNGFLSAWESGLMHSTEYPFEKGWIKCDSEIIRVLGDAIKSVKGITVNTVSGSEETIDRHINKYKPEIETMEVAAALYVGRMENIPLIALRSVSNMIEPRNRDAWDILSAIAALQPALEIILKKLGTK